MEELNPYPSKFQLSLLSTACICLEGFLLDVQSHFCNCATYQTSKQISSLSSLQSKKKEAIACHYFFLYQTIQILSVAKGQCYQQKKNLLCCLVFAQLTTLRRKNLSGFVVAVGCQYQLSSWTKDQEKAFILADKTIKEVHWETLKT